MKLKFLIIILFASCGSNNSEQILNNFSDNLVKESPWILDRVEINSIKGINGYVFSQSEIEEIALIMKNNFYCTFEFYNNGKGLWNSEGYCQNCEITWYDKASWWGEEIEENQLLWAHRSYINYYYIRSINQTTEIILKIQNENGFTIHKPDGTFIKGDHMIGNYVWK